MALTVIGSQSYKTFLLVNALFSFFAIKLGHLMIDATIFVY